MDAQLLIESYLYNTETRQPVSEAHIFFSNTAVGNFSDAAGKIKLEFSEGIDQEDLIVTHVAFNTKILEPQEFSQLTFTDTIWLEPIQIKIDELVVESTRSGKWKKRLKKFKKTFLGNDRAAKKCKILNPEVLRFEEDDENLYASAEGPIMIDNQYLGYRIHYYLSHFALAADGSMEYLGKAYFEPYSDTEYMERRDKIYRSSPKHFFKNLIDNRLETAGYTISMSKKFKDQYITLQTPPPEELIKNLGNGQYKFFFPEFLEVTNHKVKALDSRNIGVSSGGLESGRFYGDPSQENTKLSAVTSQIYKDAPYVLLNRYGNVLNSKVVKEYGFWATQRVAQQLPFEYGNENFSNSAETSPSGVPTKSDPLVLLESLVYEKDQEIKKQTLTTIAMEWELSMAPPLIDLLRLSRDTWLVTAIQKLLVEKTGVEKKDYFEWLQWLWEQPPVYSSYYSDFKALLYKHIDPKFQTYFENRDASYKIRADEIVWGGVVQDGIPPLRYPKMISTVEATYLDDTDVVFGIYASGEARAYPKRILAWHEFFVDSIGSTNIAGVYCTLCGTVIPYVTDDHDLGTSGFLYRSNKLMYDMTTQSLWSTIDGKPVVGPLAGTGINLTSHHVVTTTWKEWRALHPTTTVLDANTGYDRDYSEGNAYKDYFSTDALMFPVPLSDNRLNNKDEVLIVRTQKYSMDPLAISTKYLSKKKWHQDCIAEINVVAISSKSGASRAYASEEVVFRNYKKGILVDRNNTQWTITEDALISEEGRQLVRLPAHNIFWFAWVNNFPETRLVK